MLDTKMIKKEFPLPVGKRIKRQHVHGNCKAGLRQAGVERDTQIRVMGLPRKGCHSCLIHQQTTVGIYNKS